MWGFAVDQIFGPNLFVSFMIKMINRAKQQGYRKKAAAQLKSKVLNAKSTWINFSPWNLDTRYTFEPVLFITQVFTPTSAPPQKKGESARKFLRLPVPHLLGQRNCWEDPKHNLQGSRWCFKKGPPTWDRDGWKVYWQSGRKVVMVLSIKWCGSVWLQSLQNPSSDASQDKCVTSRFDVVFKPKDVVSTVIYDVSLWKLCHWESSKLLLIHHGDHTVIKVTYHLQGRLVLAEGSWGGQTKRAVNSLQS